MEHLEIGAIYPRDATSLSRAGRGINYANGEVRGIMVNFGPDAPYPDARLANGRILHIGEGSPSGGDQTRVGGNRGMFEMMESKRPIPTFEKVAPNRYRYLGDFLVSGFEFGHISDEYPEWRVFSFTLEPTGGVAPQLPPPDEMGEFSGDIDPGAPPERVAAIVNRFKRSQALVDKVKAANDYRCQVCGVRAEWVTAQGVPYAEAHHVIPLGDDGFDTDTNLAVLCPGCHRQIHLSVDRKRMQEDLISKLGIRG